MKNSLVTIERKRIEANRLYGVIVSQSASLTLLHEEYDFQFNGYRVLRTKDLTLCESSNTNRYGKALMKREGLWQSPPRWVRKLPVGSWPELIASFINKVVIRKDEKRGDFYIGPIREARPGHALIHYFDGCGCLGDVEKVAYGRITFMQFGDRYSTIHAKYLSSDGKGSTESPTPRAKA